MENNKLILVYYINVSHIENINDIPEYMERVKDKIVIDALDGHSIFVPINNGDETRIECINPKYVTNKELIENHNQMMEKINNNLELEIKKIKK